MFTIEELKAFVESKGNKLTELSKNKAYVLTLPVDNMSGEEARTYATSIQKSLRKLGIKELLIILIFNGTSPAQNFPAAYPAPVFTERGPED